MEKFKEIIKAMKQNLEVKTLSLIKEHESYLNKKQIRKIWNSLFSGDDVYLPSIIDHYLNDSNFRSTIFDHNKANKNEYLIKASKKDI